MRTSRAFTGRPERLANLRNLFGGRRQRDHRGRRRNRAQSRDALSGSMLGEVLESRTMLAVTAVLNGTQLAIVLGAASDSATLATGGANYTVSGTGLNGTSFTAASVARVAVVGTADAGQQFSLTGISALNASLSVDASVEGTTLSAPVSATVASASASIGSPAITLAANVTTSGDQSYAGAVQLAGSPSLTSTDGAVTFQGTVDAYSGVAMAPQSTFATGTNPTSVSIGDFNGDGKPDLAIANEDSNSVSVLLSTTAPGATAPS